MKRHEIGGSLIRWQRVGKASGFAIALAEFECPGIVSKEVRSYVEIKSLANDSEDGEFLCPMEVCDLMDALGKALRAARGEA